ncbi:hypothetical protein D1610_16635 [Sphingomonas gilva]|uniref:DUF4139 domain-containing protein n=1 Tax=Sphingomonas gilva TaxID=2305907 RepID=A0A396RJU2_9SPHN|nr:hypothetical protein D1610_16635 [Sphingomonas gilva]
MTSAAPEAVSVTIYRSPERGSDDAIDLDWLRGYALVTETRRVTIPAGTATLRFEGVAGGILAESAIVTGLPAGVSEKNLDADLLSPRSLYDRSLNRPVTVRRTYPDGRVTAEPAVIRSAAEGALVVQTREGIEALTCSGLPEALVYDGVPPGLSAKPTLSVETTSPQAYDATVTLSYLAWGFDWQANYVVELAEGGRSARLFAWVTLANGDVTSFPDAQTSVVAGRVNRESDAADVARPEPGWLHAECWAIAEDIGYLPAPAAPPPPPPPPPPPAMEMARAADVVVTGSRMAVQEELGDLKLYRVPFATTVAANAQKQVAMIDKAGVPVSILYGTTVRGDGASGTMTMLTARNRQADGLGVPLPAGPVAAFEPGGRGLLLVGEGRLDDKAIGEDVEIELAEATQVTVEAERTDRDEDGAWDAYAVTVRNANPWPIAHRLRIAKDDAEGIRRASARLAQEDGFTVWRTTIPANGERTLRYRIETPD